MTPASCCQLGIGVPRTNPPPLSGQADSVDHAPPRPVVVSTVPPTTVMYGSTLGKEYVEALNAPSSPLALTNDWPCAANSWNIGSSLAASAGFQPQEELSTLATLSVAI